MLALVLTLSAALPQIPVQARSLLIIAPSELLAAVQPLLAHKNATGLPATAVSLKDALANAVAATGCDDAERLKRFLFARKQSDASLQFVLLVGDADVMPVRFMTLDRVTESAFNVAFYPSDLYYADLSKQDGSFETWNGMQAGHHRGYFGEVHGEKHKQDKINFDGIDYLPEIAVGRWPVSTAAQVERMVQKTIQFEQWTEEGGGRTAAILCVKGWLDVRPQLQRLATVLRDPFSVQRLWWQDGKPDPAILAPSAKNVLALCNDGLGVLLHTGHGSEQGFDQCLGTAQLTELTNEHPFVVMSIGCTTARLCTLPPYEAYVDVDGVLHQGTNAGEIFTSPPPPPCPYQHGAHNTTSFGEQLLRDTAHGAVAYIGCDTGGQPCALTLLTSFTEGLEDRSMRHLGSAWNFAIAAYHRSERLTELTPSESWYPPSIYFQAMKYLLLGDPSLRLPARSALPASNTAR